MMQFKNLKELFKYYRFKKTSYSQEGEDRILWGLLNRQKKGIYVDVGAYHPSHISNTKLFYDNGWYGINIDPTPTSMFLFQTFRKRDVNLQMGVSDIPGEKVLYEYKRSYYNTFDSALVKKRKKINPKFRPYKEISIAIKPLSEILDDHYDSSQDGQIDFLDIDVEGHEIAVLKSNNWQKYRPHCVVLEMHGFEMSHPEKSEVYTFMKNKNYRFIAKTITNGIFVSRD